MVAAILSSDICRTDTLEVAAVPVGVPAAIAAVLDAVIASKSPAARIALGRNAGGRNTLMVGAGVVCK
jgi:pyrrolidone-carboxylate peptidase